MRRHKKSTSVDALQNQVHDTTPDAISLSEILFRSIGTGREHALKRPHDPRTDRALRKLINQANMEGDCIINLGDGYFRPTEDEGYMLRHYLKSESSRAKDLMKKVEKMEKAFYRRYL